jgi:hypothetical protein
MDSRLFTLWLELLLSILINILILIQIFKKVDTLLNYKKYKKIAFGELEDDDEDLKGGNLATNAAGEAAVISAG